MTPDQVFLDTYEKTKNATEAYQAAFPNSEGVSIGTLRTRASRYLERLRANHSGNVQGVMPVTPVTSGASNLSHITSAPPEAVTHYTSQPQKLSHITPEPVMPVTSGHGVTPHYTPNVTPDMSRGGVTPPHGVTHQKQPESTTNLPEWEIIEQFKKEMIAQGLLPPAQIEGDGLLHRCDVEGPGGKGDGCYLLYLDGHLPAGGMQNWRSDQGWVNWRADLGRRLRPEEERAYKARVAEAQKARKLEELQRHEQARQRASVLWEQATPCTTHPYLEKKGVGAHGVRISTTPWRGTIDNALLIPLRDWDGQMWSLQAIFPAKDESLGRDRDFLPGGRKAGLFHLLGEVHPTTPQASSQAVPVLIAEGYATGATLHEVTGWPVFVAFDAGNLMAVAVELRKRHPQVEVILAADNDRATPGNPGLSKANDAATECGGRVVFPVFEGEESGSDWNDWVANRESREDLGQEMIRLFSRPVDPIARNLEGDLPIIQVEGGNRPQCVRLAEAAMIAKGVEVFQRGGQMVRLVRLPKVEQQENRKLDRPDNALLVMGVEQAWLELRLTECAIFQEFDGRRRKWVRIDCPPPISRAMLASTGDWQLRNLAGVIEAPTLRRDGSILETPGYDAKTELFFDPGGTVFPSIPEHPTQAEARQALADLSELICEFPFVGPEHKSAMLAAFLTVLIRRSIRTAPMFGVSATKMGSGKSFLADLASILACGRRAPAITYGGDRDEQKKQLFSLLLGGDSIAVLDNISGPMSSDQLCSILSQETIKDRVLGESREITVPTTVTWFATGNKLIIQGDLSTRALKIEIDPAVERPEERSFSKNLLEWTPQHRPRLVVAALTILRAFVVAGRPQGDLKPFGRFEEWSLLVRAALVWLGEADPCATRLQVEEDDPVRLQLTGFLRAWHEAVGTERITGPKLVALAKELANPTSHWSDGRNERPEPNPSLLNRLLEIAGERGVINNRRLGRWLLSYSGRIEGGFKVVKMTNQKDGEENQYWQVMPC